VARNKWMKDEGNILLYWIFISVKILDDERLSRKKRGLNQITENGLCQRHRRKSLGAGEI
jgi:hypothetical protein